jgi:Na+/H+ antiporter NhaD/arsenite permease-like protein
VLVHTARNLGRGQGSLLYGCLLLSNAVSLFLVGSNLTNLIVLGQLHLSGGDFLARMWASALAALVVTAAVVERAASTPTARSVGAARGLGRTARCPAGYIEARWCVAVRWARSRGLLLGEGWTFPVEPASREIRSRLSPPCKFKNL